MATVQWRAFAIRRAAVGEGGSVLFGRKALFGASLVLVGATLGTGIASASGAPRRVHATGSPIAYGLVGPFTGPDAPFGVNFIAACTAASHVINNDGGVLGHQLTCVPTDTKGDPADAVPAVDKLLATQSNLVGILGPTGDEATAVAPTINAAHIPFFSTSGQSILDHWKYPYFYRLVTPDDETGYAMAVWGHERGYKRAAALFGNDISSQGTVPTLVAGLRKLKTPRLVSNQTVALDQASYRTEAEKILALRPLPQVLFSELDPQSASTFFSELKDLAGGKIPFKVILANNAVDPTWYGPVAQTIGKSTLATGFSAPNSVVATNGPAWNTYDKALNAAAQYVKNPQKYATNGITQADYDGATLMALAMIDAHSIKPSVYNKDIVALAKPSPGAIKVQTFAAGKAALAAHKRIQFIGLRTAIRFNQWHNAPAGVEMEHFTTSGAIVPTAGGYISPSAIATAQ